MEVKIGVADSVRELVVASPLSQEEVETQVSKALTGGSDALLTLVDDKGKRYIMPAARIAYVEIGPADARRVGFAVGS